MLAQDYVNMDGGFATCLRNMQTAIEQGTIIDFSNWGESAQKLIHLERKTLDALLNLYSQFHAIKCEVGQKKSNIVGLKAGRKKIELPDNFEDEVTKWLSGEISSKIAAKNCGISVSTFYTKVKERQSKTQSQEIVDAIISLWSQRKITANEASLRLGITSKSFKKIVTSRGIKRGYTPDDFNRYYELYEKGILTKEEAAKLSGVSVQHFICCIDNVEKK